ncbi:hypothetical protein [Sphingobacterium sp. LRF_L2]
MDKFNTTLQKTDHNKGLVSDGSNVPIRQLFVNLGSVVSGQVLTTQ